MKVTARKTIVLAFVCCAGAALALSGCGGGGGGGKSGSGRENVVELTKDNALPTVQNVFGAYVAADTASLIDPLVWHSDAARAPLFARGPVEPLAGVRTITDYIEAGDCGGQMTVNGTTTPMANDDIATVDLTISMSRIDQCAGARLNGTITLDAEATYGQGQGRQLEQFDAIFTLVDVSSNVLEAGRATLDGTIELVGDKVNDLYTLTSNLVITGLVQTTELKDLVMTTDKSQWPRVTVTLAGTVVIEGKSLTIATPQQLVFDNVLQLRRPSSGVIVLDGDGELTVTFSKVEALYFVNTQLDANEDGDYLDLAKGDYETGPLTGRQLSWEVKGDRKGELLP